VKEMPLIKAANRLGINARRSSAFSAPVVALCLPIHRRQMRDSGRAIAPGERFGFSSDYRNARERGGDRVGRRLLTL